MFDFLSKGTLKENIWTADDYFTGDQGLDRQPKNLKGIQLSCYKPFFIVISSGSQLPFFSCPALLGRNSR